MRLSDTVTKGLLTIGEAARATEVSARAIRLWEEKGLLEAIDRTPGGYRQFRQSDLVVMRFIRQSQRHGLSLDDVKGVLDAQRAGERPCPRVLQVLDERIVDIDRAIADLTQLRGTLVTARDTFRESTDGRDAAGICPILEGGADEAIPGRCAHAGEDTGRNCEVLPYG